ncbi:MAG: hypothetical protein RMJ19_01780 [Gemmatales bacterium]|nr:hypothetical protein [Gemmatales bacterium]MCS7159176.1 hypothetical protein [Gemmatales bacterium]MDW8174376.1 hypothetical protein [Gemmatales bacterium]MDW8221812.1 hypothetical protein [Gemmatales bacterium]
MLSIRDGQTATSLPYRKGMVPGPHKPEGAGVRLRQELGAFAPRFLVALFRRDPSRDTYTEKRVFEGYQIFWPDGEPAGVSLERFCQLGCRLLGLGKRMQGREEQLVEMGVYPLPEGLDSPLTPTPPGVRSRRFYLMRENHLVRVYFFNGSPTEVCFDTVHDNPCVLEWIGALDLPEGEQRWFDFTACTLDSRVSVPRGWFTRGHGAR